VVWTSNGDCTVYDIGGEPDVQSILDDENIASERVEATFRYRWLSSFGLHTNRRRRWKSAATWRISSNACVTGETKVE
jgi:hypothetical protein